MILSPKILNQVLAVGGKSSANTPVIIAFLIILFPGSYLSPKAAAAVPEWVTQTEGENNNLTWQAVDHSVPPQPMKTASQANLPPTFLPESQIIDSPSTVAMLITPDVDSSDVTKHQIQVQSPLDVAVRIRINGALIEPQAVTKDKVDPENNLIIQTWHQVDLEPGTNEIEVVDKFGKSLDSNVITVETSKEEVREPWEARTSVSEGVNEELSELPETQPENLVEEPQPSTAENLDWREEERETLEDFLEEELIIIEESVRETEKTEIIALEDSIAQSLVVEETEIETFSIAQSLEEEIATIEETLTVTKDAEVTVSSLEVFSGTSVQSLIDSLEEELTHLGSLASEPYYSLAEGLEAELNELDSPYAKLENDLTVRVASEDNSESVETSVPSLLRSLAEELALLSASDSSSTETNTLIAELDQELAEIEKEEAIPIKDAPARLDIKLPEARIQADGETTATVEGRFLDEQGNPSAYEGIVTLNSSAGTFLGTDVNPQQPGFQVRVKEGKFAVPLQGGTEPQTVTIQAVSEGTEAYTQLEFQPDAEISPSLVTGVINLRLGTAGTDFYDSFRDFLSSEEDGKTALSASGAAFATGKVGEWQFTGALNSDRALNEDGSGIPQLNPEIQSDQQIYPVYGDDSTITYRASSQDSFFFKLEQSPENPDLPQNFLMWGTYTTPEFSTTAQTFSATERTLQGFKGNYTLDHVQFTAFYSENLKGFERDAIAPDGTSGLYFLSQQLLIPGSEAVYLETQPLQRPGKVVSRQKLRRDIHYIVDYDRGTLLFKKPVLRTTVGKDGTVLAQRIIVNYQFESTADETSIAGGRLQYHFSHGKKKVG